MPEEVTSYVSKIEFGMWRLAVYIAIRKYRIYVVRKNSKTSSKITLQHQEIIWSKLKKKKNLNFKEDQIYITLPFLNKIRYRKKIKNETIIFRNKKYNN